MIPGLENAEFARLGGLHRNTYLNSPRLLDGFLRLKADPRLRFAGQITGCEGYVESAAVGLMACLLSPVAWIHHFHWIVVVIFALLGADPLRDRRRLWAGLGVTAFFLCRLPWWGISWLNQPTWPELPGRLLQNADVAGALAALALLWWVTRDEPAEPAEPNGQRTPAISSAE